MRRLFGVLLAVVFLTLGSAPASAQNDESWKNQWYWGLQGGYYLFHTPTRTDWYYNAYSIGGHWLITADRMGLFVSIDQANFEDGVTSAVSDGSSVYTVAMGASRIISGELVAMPSIGKDLQFHLGAGFNIQHIIDAQASGSFASPSEEAYVAQLVDDAASKAFVQFSAAVQFNYQKWAFYGKYQLMPQATDYLITGEQHWFTVGLRYAITRASDDVVTER
jgi:hypothetical protein